MYTKTCKLGVLLPGLLLLSFSLVLGCQQQNIRERSLSMQESTNMRKCMVNCTQMSEMNRQYTEQALKALNSASAAMDSGSTQQAKTDLAEAQKNIQSIKTQMGKMQQQMPCANVCCPLSGKPIDMTNVPKEKTRMHKGVKLGFHEKADMAVWDKMSDAEKDEKANQVLPPGMDVYMYDYTK